MMPKGQHSAYHNFWAANDSTLVRLRSRGLDYKAIGVKIFGDSCAPNCAATKAGRRGYVLGLDSSRSNLLIKRLNKDKAAELYKKIKSGELTHAEAAKNLLCNRDTLSKAMRLYYSDYNGHKLKPIFWTKARLKELHYLYYKKGFSYEECQKHFGNTSIQHVFRQQGWKARATATSARLRRDRHLLARGVTREDWKTYFNRIRVLTNEVYRQYAHIIDPQRLRSRAHHLDHCLAIRASFENTDNWHLVVHPANLAIITAHANLSKNHRGSWSVKRARRRIRMWERRHGKVGIRRMFEVDSIMNCDLPNHWYTR